MTKKCTYQYLMMITEDINRQTQASLTYGIFHREKIAAFQKANKISIDKFNRSVEGLTQEFALLDDKGNPTMTMKDNQPIMLFKDEDSKKGFQDKYFALLAEPVTLIL